MKMLNEDISGRVPLKIDVILVVIIAHCSPFPKVNCGRSSRAARSVGQQSRRKGCKRIVRLTYLITPTNNAQWECKTSLSFLVFVCERLVEQLRGPWLRVSYSLPRELLCNKPPTKLACYNVKKKT